MLKGIIATICLGLAAIGSGRSHRAEARVPAKSFPLTGVNSPLESPTDGVVRKGGMIFHEEIVCDGTSCKKVLKPGPGPTLAAPSPRPVRKQASSGSTGRERSVVYRRTPLRHRIRFTPSR